MTFRCFRPLSDILNKVQNLSGEFRLFHTQITSALMWKGLNFMLKMFEKTAEASDVSSAGRLSNLSA